MKIKKTFETTAWIIETEDPEEAYRFDQLKAWEKREGNKWVPVTNRKKKKEIEELYLAHIKDNSTYLNTFESDFTPIQIMRHGLPIVRVSKDHPHWSQVHNREAGNKGLYNAIQEDIKKLLRKRKPQK